MHVFLEKLVERRTPSRTARDVTPPNVTHHARCRVSTLRPTLRGATRAGRPRSLGTRCARRAAPSAARTAITMSAASPRATRTSALLGYMHSVIDRSQKPSWVAWSATSPRAVCFAMRTPPAAPMCARRRGGASSLRSAYRRRHCQRRPLAPVRTIRASQSSVSPTAKCGSSTPMQNSARTRKLRMCRERAAAPPCSQPIKRAHTHAARARCMHTYTHSTI